MIDFNINNGNAVVINDIELVLQQIDLLFDTSPREVFENSNFGSRYDHYLYKLNLSNNELRRLVVSDLDSLDLCGFDYEVNVHLLQGTEQDIALIEIILTKENEKYERIYKIS